MDDLFDKINQRTFFDKTKLFNHKIKEIIQWIDIIVIFILSFETINSPKGNM